MAICYCPPTRLGSCATCRDERAAQERLRRGEIAITVDVRSAKAALEDALEHLKNSIGNSLPMREISHIPIKSLPIKPVFDQAALRRVINEGLARAFGINPKDMGA